MTFGKKYWIGLKNLSIKNDEINVSDASSFEHAIKKFKVVILDKIKERLESSDDEDDGDEMNTEEMSDKEMVDRRAIS